MAWGNESPLTISPIPHGDGSYTGSTLILFASLNPNQTTAHASATYDNVGRIPAYLSIIHAKCHFVNGNKRILLTLYIAVAADVQVRTFIRCVK